MKTVNAPKERSAMKRVLHSSILLAVVVASAVGLAGLAPGQASAEVARNPGTTTNYAIQIIAPSGSCGVALSKRTGHWACLTSDASASAIPQEQGKCLVDAGCWYVLSSTSSEYETTGYYGYGDKRLGVAKLFFNVILRGYQSVSKVRFESTGAVSSLFMTGERLYWDKANPECHEDSPSTFKFIDFGPVRADKQEQWPGDGYVASQSTVHVASVLHGWTWTVADYPGTWYIYAKSVKFLLDEKDRGYRYESVEHLCALPVTAGWSPE
jgi:hypothetical protein